MAAKLGVHVIGFLQGPVLHLVLFDIFTNGLDDGAKSTFPQCVRDTKLGGVASILEQQIKIQTGSETSRVEFKKRQWKRATLRKVRLSVQMQTME